MRFMQSYVDLANQSILIQLLIPCNLGHMLGFLNLQAGIPDNFQG